MNNANSDSQATSFDSSMEDEGQGKTLDYFQAAIRSMSEARLRPDISLGDIRPPRNLAPLSHAVGLEISGNNPDDEDLMSSGDAFGRLILLHDPAGEEDWEGAKMRMVAYIQADMDAAVAADPLLPEVAWDWLTEELGKPAAEYTDLGGTVTSTTSVRYGDIGGPPRAYQIEMRASWTATGVDLSGHVQAFGNVLANVAGLPPEGVASLPEFGEN